MRKKDWTMPSSSAPISPQRTTPFNRGRSCAATAAKSASVVISPMRIVSSSSGGFKSQTSLERALNGLSQQFEAFQHGLRRVRLADDYLKGVIVPEQALDALHDGGLGREDFLSPRPKTVQRDHHSVIQRLRELWPSVLVRVTKYLRPKRSSIALTDPLMFELFLKAKKRR